jgi:hypothetical protein
MNKKVLIISVSVLLILLVAAVGYNYVLHGGARNLSNEDTAFSITSKVIIDEFSTQSDASTQKYLDKAIAISGTITSISEKEVILDDSIICILKVADASLKENQAVTLKGRLVGYDDLLGEIKLDQCFKEL